MKKAKRKQIPKDPVVEIVALLDRVVTQAGVTQFQIAVINRRLDALERLAALARRRK